MQVTLASMPEEILERILELVLTSAVPPTNYRPSWHSYLGAHHPAVPARLAPLLVCRAWLRIATPLHYRHVVLRSGRQTALLAGALCASPELGHWVRTIRIEGTFAALPDVVHMCPQLESFDMTVDNGGAITVPGACTTPAAGRAGSSQAGAEATATASETDAEVMRFCSAFRGMRRVKHLVIRKNAYLTQPRPTLVFEELGKAIKGWKYLETVNIAFRFSPSPASATFAASLAVAPRLRHVRALLPAVWNTTLLEISANPSLERIQLTPDTELMGAHLFLSEARKHARLTELIRAGTPIMRMRARTTTALTPAPDARPLVPAPSSYPSSSSLSASYNPAHAQVHAQPRTKHETHAHHSGGQFLSPQVRSAPSGRRMSAV